MSEPIQIPSKLKLQSSNQGSAAGSPLEVARVGIAPTSFTTRRTRTTSVTKKIDERDLEDGTVLAFSRTKGHGFLKGVAGDSIFFHVSDVNGEVIPREQDLVKYRVIEIPPNFQKTQAVQVTLVNENRLIGQGRPTWADEKDSQASQNSPKTPPPTPI